MPIPVLAAVVIGAAAEAITGIGKKTIKMVTGGSKKRTTTKARAKAKAKSTSKRKPSTTKKSTSSAGKKANGTLKKGFRYAKGGRVVKAKG